MQKNKITLNIKLFHIRLFIVLYILENYYFGWNKYPQSVSEVICDIFLAWLFINIFIEDYESEK